MVEYAMYKVRYHSLISKSWFEDRTWSKFKSRIEFGNAQLLTHLDIIELWKFNWWKWKWELTDTCTK